jgi:predicted permease
VDDTLSFFMNAILLLIPDLAMIAIGALLYRFWHSGREFWPGIERLTYFVLFPSLLFTTVARTRFVAGEALPALSVTLGAIAVGIILGFAARWLLRPQPVHFASGVQCAFRFNSYVMIALSQRMAGDEGLALAAVIVGMSVPLLNIAAVYSLARNAGGSLWRELARNPLLLATTGGMIVSLTQMPIPEPILATTARLGQASLALGLLAAGAGLRFERVRSDQAQVRASAQRLALWFTSVKLVAMPATALLMARVFNLPPLATLIVVMYASLPTAPAAYILASRMGGDGPFVAYLISLSLLGSLLALPVWLNLAGA